jgi:sugar lactone lactonase YvrE
MNGRYGKISSRMAIGLVIAAAAVAAIVTIVTVDVTGEKGNGLSQAYDLDVNALAAFDPNLICYRAEGPAIATGFAHSRAIALDAGASLYIAGDKAVRIMDASGDLQRTIEIDGEPKCLAVAADGTLYVGLRDHVEIFDSKGQRQSVWASLGDRAYLTSIALAGPDAFLADAGNAVVLHCDPTGKVLNRIAPKNEDAPTSTKASGFIVPSPYFDVAIAPDGLLRVVNPGMCRIEAYTFKGDMETSWGRNSAKIDGFCGCCNPVNIAILPDGKVVTAEKGLIRVKVYNADGTLDGVVAGPDQLVKGGAGRVFQTAADALASGFDVAVDAKQRVYVLDTIENTVRVFVRSRN